MNTQKPTTGAIRPPSAFSPSLQNHLAGIVCDLEYLRDSLPMPESYQEWSLLDSAWALTRKALDRITADRMKNDMAGTIGGASHD